MHTSTIKKFSTWMLPAEIVDHLLDYLPHTDLFSLCLTSRYFASRALSRLWDSVEVELTFTPLSNQHLFNLVVLLSIHKKPVRHLYLHFHETSVSMFDDLGDAAEDNVMQLMRRTHTTLHTLDIVAQCDQDVRFSRTTSLLPRTMFRMSDVVGAYPMLEHLSITVDNDHMTMGKRHVESALRGILNAGTPKLRVLDLGQATVLVNADDFTRVMEALPPTTTRIVLPLTMWISSDWLEAMDQLKKENNLIVQLARPNNLPLLRE
jgi:hypothetical protein